MLVQIEYATGKHGSVKNYSARRLKQLLAAGKIVGWEKVERFTPEQEAHILAVKRLPCTVCGKDAPSEAHHCGTGMGRRKDHGKCIPVCLDHHISRPGGSCGLSRREWEREFGTEQYHLDKTELRLRGE